MIRAQLDAAQALQSLADIDRGGRLLAPVMRDIKVELISQTEANFAAEGRPRWKPLARATVEKRIADMAGGAMGGYRKDGRISKSVGNSASGMKILQASTALARSISGESGHDYAQVGSNLPYAAIQQLGGKAGRGLKVRLPARPYLPMTADGRLQPEAETAILEIAIGHLRRAAGV
jgi:phage gpG-like protein